MKLRDIDPHDTAEITLVAERMGATLIEVEGQELYDLDWRIQRVRWHLDPANTQARVVLGIDEAGAIVGHTIFRIEHDEEEEGRGFGLVSTSYVVPAARRQGFANAFLSEAEAWFRSHALPLAATWTSSTNAALIALYARHGFAEDQRGPNDLTGTGMVRLAKRL